MHWHSVLSPSIAASAGNDVPRSLQTLDGDESFQADMFPDHFPLEKVLDHSYLHWAPTCYRGASFYCRGDPQLPKGLRDEPQCAFKVTAA